MPKLYRLRQTTRICLPLAASLLLLPHPLQTVAQTDNPEKAAKALTVDDVLWWLPEDTETILVAQGPFRLNALPESETPRLEPLLEWLPTAPLEGNAIKQLSGRSVSFILEGSRHFRKPTSLGDFPYEGCHILVFQDDLDEEGEAILISLSKHADRHEKIHGVPTAIFERKWEEDMWTIFVSHPKPNVLLCATSRKYLAEVLTRSEDRAESRALPQELPEWEHVDRTSKFWAVRHYGRDNAVFDPSSPIGKKPSGFYGRNDHAIGCAVAFDPRLDPPVATITYLSEKKDGPSICEQVRKITSSLSDYHLLLYSLGHGINF